MSEFSPFWAEMRDMELVTTRSRRKERGRDRPLSDHKCPQCGHLYGGQLGRCKRENHGQRLA